MKQVIVTADDLGLDRALNVGILEAHRQGLVTAAAIVSCGEAFEDAVERVGDRPSLDIGVHLTLDEERPPAGRWRTIVDADGRFHPRLRLIRQLSAGRVDLDEVQACWRLQIERCLAAGLTPSFLNSHGHVHAFPTLLPIASGLAREFGIAAIRRPVEPPSVGAGLGALCRQMLITVSARYAFARARAPIATTDHFAGLAQSGHLNAARLAGVLASLRDGVTELMTHPGRADAATIARYGHWSYEWAIELEALQGVSLPPGVTLTTFARAFGKAA